MTITEDRLGEIYYWQDDYRRMVRMGANFVVIRVMLGRIGRWPGEKEDPAYFGRLDSVVQMARDAGLQTIFKLVVYDVKPFGPAQWDALFKNTDGAQNAIMAGWKKIWVRYRDEPSVFGYELFNEPYRGLDPDEARCMHQLLLPLLRRLADTIHEISPEKWAFF